MIRSGTRNPDHGEGHVDFTKPWDHSDVVFIVEGQKVYANKTILSMSSPVIKAMLQGPLSKKEAKEMKLSKTELKPFLYLMKTVHPRHRFEDFPDEDFDKLMLLIDEYQMDHLKTPIENHLLKQHLSLHRLVLADRCGLTDLRKACLERAVDKYLTKDWLSGYRSAYDQLEPPRHFTFRCQHYNTEQIVDAKQDEIDFTKPWDHSDITFIVEGQKVYANKMILSMSSPVMKEIFKTAVGEKDEKEIELPGKKLKPFLDLMKNVHKQNLSKDVVVDKLRTVDQMLPLIHEYQMTHLKRPIEKCLQKQELSVQSLVLADKYGLTELKEDCLSHVYFGNSWLSEYKDAYDQLETSRDFRCHQCITQQEETNQTNPQEVSCKLEDIDYTKPWDHSDITFIVEGQKVYANKTVLSMSSPVMKAMFNSDFREKDTKEIELPGKMLQPFLGLMKIGHPPNQFKEYNFEKLVPLAHEYQMTHILQLCDKNLLKQPLSIGRLVLADKYNLTELREVCLEYAKSTPLETVKRDELYDQVESGIKVEILEHNLRKMAKEAGDAARDANKAFQQIQKLAESSVCQLNHSLYQYPYNYPSCRCPASNNALRQIKQISARKGSTKPDGP